MEKCRLRAVTRWLPTSSLIELPNRYWKELGCPNGQTDIICITDAIVRVPTDVRDNFLRWKVEAQARLLSLIIQGRPGDLAAVSDDNPPRNLPWGVRALPKITASRACLSAILIYLKHHHTNKIGC